ncbi:MAG: DNA-3-methyladenine glycosylase [Euryarchaeota archaeon]|nr:DNA-3-methyladenine glycosylase [Euryarchaeota archaeon]
MSTQHRVLITTEVDINKLLSTRIPVAQVGTEERYLTPISPLPQEFFMRDAKEVAMELLGKLLVRKISNTLIVGKIVETEAYYGDKDPASRAYRGKKDYNRGMWLPGGHIFVYMVHANWMFNITADGEDAQAVLLRAIEPLAGLEIMRQNRKKEKIKELCSGPGKLSRAFGITSNMNEKMLGDEVMVADAPRENISIVKKHRIGVREDLPEPLRFYIEGNRFVSKK